MESRSSINDKHAICGICPAGCWVTVTYDEKGMIDKYALIEALIWG